MPPRRKPNANGVKLPSQLQNELGTPSVGGRHGKKAKKAVSRKELRKQERLDKKQRKVKRPSRPISALSSEPVAKIEHPTHSVPSNGKRKVQLEKESPTKKRKLDIKPRSTNVEDEEIARYEKLLGLDKKKSKKASIDEDGLDSLLDGIDGTTTYKDESASEAEDSSESEDYKDEDAASGDGSAEDDEDVSEPSIEEAKVVKEAEISTGPIVEETKIVPTPATKYVPPHLRKKLTAEDAARNEMLQKLTRQLQGHLNRLSESNIESIVLEIEEAYRQYSRHDVTTTLTKLILTSIESKINLLDTFVVLYATFVAAMYKIIGAEFGAHLVQTLVETFDKYYATAQSVEDDGGKECNNFIVFVAALYKSQVISCILIYDFVRLFLSDLKELNIELLLRILKECGQQLRQDDPTALKDMIALVQSSTAGMEKSLSSRTRFMIETLTALKNNRLKQTAGGVVAADTSARMKKFLSGISSKRHVVASEPLRVSLEDVHSVETKGKWWLVGASWKANMVGEAASSKGEDGVETDSAMEALLKLAAQQKMNTDVRKSIFIVLMTSEDYVDASERLDKLSLRDVQQRELVRVLIRCAENEKTFNPYYALIANRLCQMQHKHKVTFQFCLWDFFRVCGEKGVGGQSFGGQDDEWDDDTEEGNSVPTYRVKNMAKLYAYLIAKNGIGITVLKTLEWNRVLAQGAVRNEESESENDSQEESSSGQFRFTFKRPTRKFLYYLMEEILTVVSKTKKKGKVEINEQGLVDVFSRTSHAGPLFVKGIKAFLEDDLAEHVEKRETSDTLLIAESIQAAVKVLNGIDKQV